MYQLHKTTITTSTQMEIFMKIGSSNIRYPQLKIIMEYITVWHEIKQQPLAPTTSIQINGQHAIIKILRNSTHTWNRDIVNKFSRDTNSLLRYVTRHKVF